ncbi:MAG: flavodoxin-dependent (E)-4-hydroxy-3-methylbut-2-enyl-diphosphate synthase [Coriobacteriales bacterium]|nr:flavodoxin-dependent (E)-4-hydroxy-3-methylbut-2-enyl-diphosphate synthase [Coriobacteriales bacterium]MBQ6586799.1 flavodoxin-dependent (E)-4-hydroxy-3-methylbut-2-enyl-diphosphate synthase [Coriobacteriales bacterium]
MLEEAKLPRELTRKVRVGEVCIGGGSPVAVQSMTNVPMIQGEHGPLLDVEGNLAQIARFQEAGCEIARVAVPNRASIEPFGRICEASPLPVVADIHFDHLIAIGAARAGASKLRINPGNIGGQDRVDEVIEVAGECGIPIRIGVNGGSLDMKWRERHELSLPERLAGSVAEFVEHFEDRGFKDIVVSAKAHDVQATMETYRLLSREIPQVPLHLGITEAGTFLQGSVKSSVGIGALLLAGIGDTFRVSLTADPVEELHVAWEILAACGLRRRSPELVSCPTCSRCQVDMIPIAKEVEQRLRSVRKPLKVAVMGCVVNGPGEAADADIGVACGKDSGILFKGGQKLRKVAAGEIVDALFQEIEAL